ncbi:glycoside hydrolase family 73 protein [Flavobacterium sp. B183]|uniref:glycoside hydrolase family 73 protein n=1 Tax=Flavobacterium sp. B183 TaxID=907046 RepID=UPI00201FB305|nr:glucosaminidase domain-containing protein [Flavobacterium sp. B183]URC13932.1 glucosaminidase domain-containing protein [Flavobacterium sp. B183]URC14047.1 glucosaminidase domain-containing protein [Flavobacterium sp. B183]
MTPRLFVETFLPHAQRVELKTGISAIAILTQAALESAWGEVAPGNMFFGVKDTDGLNGNEQLLTTTEYTKNVKNPMPVHISSTPVVRNGVKMFKHKGKDYFRKYSTPEDCFNDHAQFFIKNKRYSEALKVKNNYIKFFDAIAKAGYATDPNYAATLKAVSKSITKHI